MKRLILCIAFALSAVGVSFSATLSFKAGNAYGIYRPEKASPSEMTACEELAEYMRKMTGAEFRIEAETARKGDAPAIYVGETGFAAGQKIDFKGLEREEWIIRTVGGNLLLAGGAPRGTYYAVLEFLEMNGVVWPDETTEFVPKNGTLNVGDLDLRGKPGIAYRRITLGMSTFNDNTRRFFARCRRNDLSIPEKYGFGEEMSGHHTFHDFTSPDWPDEYFSLNGGKRVRSNDGGGPGQLCMSNKSMQEAVLAKLKAKIAKDRAELPPSRWPRIYDISQNDNDSYCTCDNCMAIMRREDAYSGVLLEFINHVADGIADEYPEVLVQTFAYTHTLKPPKSIRPANNVLMRVCKLGYEFSVGDADTLVPVTNPRNKVFADILGRWADISSHIAIWDYWILYYKNPFPYVNAKAIASDIRTYKSFKANNMLVECEDPEKTSFSAFKQWLGYHLMVHPEAELEALEKRFFNAYYGKAAQIMLDYMHYVEARMDATDIPLAKAGTLSIPYLDREFFQKANALLDKAEKAAAGDGAALTHIAYERVPVDAALLDMRAKFQNSLPSGGLSISQLFDRYGKNLLAHTAYYYEDGIAYDRRAGDYDNCKTVLEVRKKVFMSNDLQIPEKYKGRLVCDVNWSMGNHTLLVDDSDALFGKALKLPEGKDYHRLPINIGIYDTDAKKNTAEIVLSESDIPQDEKFHFYSLGVHSVKPQMFCWITWTWLISLRLDYAYEPQSGNHYEIVLSMKVTGSPYVKASKLPPAVLVDRILILKKN